ncbi:hypothetical protein Droror1_Dr00019703 [Drosera rotundifolia]
MESIEGLRVELRDLIRGNFERNENEIAIMRESVSEINLQQQQLVQHQNRLRTQMNRVYQLNREMPAVRRGGQEAVQQVQAVPPMVQARAQEVQLAQQNTHVDSFWLGWSSKNLMEGTCEDGCIGINSSLRWKERWINRR